MGGKTVRKRDAPAVGYCALLLAHKPSVIDEEMIRRVIGKKVLRTLTEVAAEFGVESTTLRANWRQQGMPGKQNAWPVADILIWRLKHEAAVAERQPGNTAKSQAAELREIEIEERLFEFERKKRRALQEDGHLRNCDEVQKELIALISVFREMILRVPALIEPMLPARGKNEIKREIDKQLRRVLTAMSEKSCRQILNEAMRLMEESA